MLDLALLDAEGPSHHDPIQAEHDFVGARRMVSESAAPPLRAQFRAERSRVVLGIEIAREDDRRRLRIALSVGEDLVHLRVLDVPEAAALEVQVVDHERAPAVIELGNDRDPAAEPPLKQWHVRNVGSGAPEAGLRLKADHARVADGQARENRLALIRRPLAVALAEFLPRESERVAHLQALGELIRDVEVGASARREIDLLKQTQVGLISLENFGDLIEPRAAIDVPVDDVEGSGLPRGVREIARENPVELGWGVLGRTAPGRRTNQERRERREQKEVLLDQVLFYS